MDLLIFVMGLVFLGLIGAGIFFFLKEPAFSKMLGFGTGAPVKPAEGGADPAAGLQKKILHHEERIATLENELKASREESERLRGREQELLKERSNAAFDSESFEKMKEEHVLLKKELTTKEETLETEISARRRQNTELTQLRLEYEALKKKTTETEDALRKAQTTIEGLREENKNIKSLLEQHKKIVDEHNVNKSEGQWVSRIEFERVEAVLKEKERLIEKLQSPPEKE
ncbi:MAG: hypothetical protein PHF12_02060 [Candidatus Omnitrophica bacterium]|nr:hypothetical protein [Candidatus Omnitrophota bacterium]